ncbi:inorganic phosphate transporter [Mangrovibacterium diazotrophicum]|uniref:Phosphate transporter n=1 Tax=Mangrovibacterium diazotrophicum TaxID=1261403 RepID=A0A419WA78_9BACT|nr:inorganic phosphate transporter [Mangrovibacterium diazotrophicum]RKD92353.1 phosphate/sulfate permease [Mangrovibacterium diazotrophicum]
MEHFYLILVVVLFALAISDLIVGVSNDAVNFLNSAIGSKAAPKWLIFGVASLGVLVGSVFSSGMMEVARKGIFHPDMFMFSEIMIIFLAVMITDVILLDMFNTFGLPTSTTVSIVFELLGAAVAVSFIKIKMAGQSIGQLSEYINSEKALAIISGILVSVIIAFIVGALVQYIARMVFSFRQHRTLKYYGAVFGGLSIAAMTYFMIIKGAKGATFITEDMLKYMTENMLQILIFSFIGWTVVLQLFTWLFKIDIPKIIVLVGTFGLAMAFAGNDLVNFIGVPLAGFQSFKAWIAGGGIAADSFSMEMLKGKVATPSYMLVIAGFVMIITLITSRKAQNVVATSVDLSRQNEGDERFGSSMLSRIIVRKTMQANKNVHKILPASLNRFIDSRFEHPKGEKIVALEDEAAFDKIRAAINLIVSGILISIGTSLKLPLSTTYVTFMVAMGTSLADRAWGRESAVYRISGVFAVVGGWFLTALVAFTVSLVIALIISLSGNFMIFVFIGLAIFTVVRTHTVLRKRAANKQSEEEEHIIETDGTDKVIDKTKKQVLNAVITINQVYSTAVESFIDEERTQLREAVEMKTAFDKKSKKMKNKVSSVIEKLQQSDSLDLGHFYVQLVDYMREVSHSLSYLVDPMHEHLENNHKPFTDAQAAELKSFLTDATNFVNLTRQVVEKEQFEELNNVIKQRDDLIIKIGQLEKAQIKRIKNKEVNTRNSVLFFNIISETKNLLMHYVNLIKAQRDFFSNARK